MHADADGGSFQFPWHAIVGSPHVRGADDATILCSSFSNSAKHYCSATTKYRPLLHASLDN